MWLSTLCLTLAVAQAAAADPSTVTKRHPGLQVYHIGNSHTHSVRNALMPLAIAAGHPEHSYSWSSILGAPLRWIWDHDEQSGGWEGEPYSKGLAPSRRWDALTLQAYASDDREIECAVNFAELAYRGNPKCQVYMYTIWPDSKHDWDNPPKDRTEATTERCAAAIAQRFPHSPPPRVVPTSLIIRELGKLADEGRLPGVANRFAMLSDGGHLSNYGTYAVNVAFCAMMYGEAPFDYPTRIGSYATQSLAEKKVDLEKTQFEIPTETADVIKQVVWDVLSTYKPAGIDVGLVIANRRLPPAIVGQPYKAQLESLNATGTLRWSLTQGSLPAGLTLSPQGLLEGTPTAAGKAALTIEVADGKAAFARRVALTVSEDRRPTIATDSLKGVRLDDYVFQPLAAEGGVGHLTWTLVDGKLPHGIALTRPGILVGTPGEAGEFSFAVKVDDSHPAGARSAQRALRWTILSAGPNALVVAKTGEPIEIDGKLDEPTWKLTEKIERRVAGAAGKTATFALLWSEKNKDGLRDNVYLAIKVLDGAAGKTPKDGVELFLDALHDRQVVYNADDTHFTIGRDGRSRSVRGKPNWFLKVAAAEIEGGYVLEITIPTNYWVGEGSWVDFGAKAVYGLDIAVNEGDKQLGQQVWRGTARNAEDTSGFGSIVLGE
jgi:hypothetical protein